MRIKTLLITTALLTFTVVFSNKGYSQENLLAEMDSLTTENEQEGEKAKYPRLYGGLTFTRIDWGFSRLIDNGNFKLSEENNFLAYSKASNFGFDILQFGLRFNDNFKSYISAGFEWNYLRLKNNVLLLRDSEALEYEIIDPNIVDYRKNILTTTYLRLPLSFEWRSNTNSNGKRVKVAFGAMAGILLKGSQRLKSNANGKQSFKDNYNFSKFQYGPFIRVGYRDIGIFSKYYVNDIFDNSPDQQGIHNLAFGVTLGF